MELVLSNEHEPLKLGVKHMTPIATANYKFGTDFSVILSFFSALLVFRVFLNFFRLLLDFLCNCAFQFFCS